jgi:methionine biosynthesis protein MetW
MLDNLLKRLKSIYFNIFEYPPLSIEETNYDEYWKKRITNGSSEKDGDINSFQKERADWALSKISDNTKVMDISCGSGGILLYMKKNKNITPIATEISNYAIEFLKKKKIKAHKCDLQDSDQIQKLPKVDYIILFEILEHLQNPEKILRLLERKASKSLFISVPNTAYFTHRLRMLFGRSVMQWIVHPSEHLRFWTYKDMKWWLNELGYGKKSEVHIYQGVPVLNKIWKSLFGKGMVIEIKLTES